MYSGMGLLKKIDGRWWKLGFSPLDLEGIDKQGRNSRINYIILEEKDIVCTHV